MTHDQDRLQRSERLYRSLVENGADAIAILNADGTVAYVSPSITRVLGYTEEEAMALDLFSIQHPDDVAGVAAKVEEAMRNPGVPIQGHTSRIRHKDGSWRWLEATVTNLLHDPVINGIVDNFRDVTALVVARQIEALERRTMEAAMSEMTDVRPILAEHLQALESVFPNMTCTLLSVQDGRVHNLAAPSFPQDVWATFEGQEIGPRHGSCGTAAHTHRTVIVADIATDPRWEAYRESALAHGFRACWSQPVFDSSGSVIATFANYHREVKEPSESELEHFRRSAALIGLVLENHTRRQALRASNERFQFAAMATSDAIFDWDIRRDVFIWGEAFQTLFSHPITDDPFRLADWLALMHPEDVAEGRERWDSFLTDESQTRWTNRFRFLRADGTYAFVEENAYLIRDNAGRPVRMIGVLHDATAGHTSEIRRQMERDIAEIFRSDEAFPSIQERMLEYLVRSVSGDYGEFWLLNSEGTELVRQRGYGLTPEGSHFARGGSLVTAFTHGDGLPGAVWEEGRLLIWTDLPHEKRFRRVAIAAEAGMKDAIGFPIAFGNRFIGVVLILSRNAFDPSDAAVSSIHALKDFLGAEIRRKQQEVAFRLFFESSPEILAIASPNGRFVRVNPTFCKTLGYSEAELTSRPFQEFILPEDRAMTATEYQETITGERLASGFLNRYLTKGGDIVWLSWNSSPAFGDDGHVFAYARNVTEVVRLRELFDNAAKLARVGSWEVDLRHETVYWSDVTRAIHEVDDPTYRPTLQNGLDFYKADVRHVIRNAVERCMDQGTPWDLELPILSAKGNERWIRTIGTSEFRDGKLVRLYGSFQDIHDRKTAEQALIETLANLKRSNEELEQFAYVASHDLQEPLRMISSFLTQLERKYKDQLDDKARQYIHFAVDGASRMRQIILDLLDYSRVGRFLHEAEPVSLAELVDEYRVMRARLIREKRADIRTEGLPTVTTHRAPLAQILNNLIDNALKYAKEGVPPDVLVKGERVHDVWSISVHDNGIGIEPEYFDKIFVIFQRLHDKQSYGGTGMGLSIVKKIVENLGGAISVESVPGEGSTFTFTLPT